MELFDQVRGYATRKNAIDKLAKETALNQERWFIVALPNGRFAPCVVRADNLHLTQKGICVVG